MDYARLSTVVPQWGLSGRAVFIQHAGVRTEKITIFGRSGGAKFKPGEDHNGALQHLQGYKLFQELEKFLYFYEQARGGVEDPTSLWDAPMLGQPVRLVYRALFEKKNLYVEPLNFTWTRDARGSRFGYIYRLELLAYKDFTSKKKGWDSAISDALDKVNNAVGSVNGHIAAFEKTVGTVFAELSAITGMINALRRTVKVVTSAGVSIGDGINNTVLGAINASLGLCTDVMRMVDDVFGSFAGGAWYSTGASADLHDTINAVSNTRRNLALMLSSNGYKYPADPERGNTSRGLPLTSTGGASHGGTISDDLDDPGALETAPMGATSGAGVGQFAIFQGESLKDFALRVSGSIGLWLVIASLNNLVSNGQFSDGSPLVAGTKLLAPLPKGGGGGIIFANSPMYDVDLQLSPQGDLVVVGNGDLALVSGISNLKQGITTRLRTNVGEVTGAPSMGMPKVIGKKQLASTAGILATTMEAQLLADARVKGIKDIQLEEDAGVIQLNITVTPYAGADFDVAIDSEVVS